MLTQASLWRISGVRTTDLQKRALSRRWAVSVLRLD